MYMMVRHGPARWDSLQRRCHQRYLIRFSTEYTEM